MNGNILNYILGNVSIVFIKNDDLLQAWWRVITPDGTIVLSTADLFQLADVIMQWKSDQ